jgi:hypothetical protein
VLRLPAARNFETETAPTRTCQALAQYLLLQQSVYSAHFQRDQVAVMSSPNNKRRRIIVDDEADNDLDDRERFVNVNNEKDEDNESIGSNPDAFDEEVDEEEGEGEDLAETWDKYV